VYYFREDASLTALRAHLQSDRRPKPNTLGLAAIVCLILLVLLAVAQVTHVHPVGSDADHCPLCVAMHSVVPFVVMVAAVVLVRIGTATPVMRETRTIIRYWHPTLFNRPPPAGR
jgi:p-aminobenzoyl-glutamate transporter AbgT